MKLVLNLSNAFADLKLTNLWHFITLITLKIMSNTKIFLKPKTLSIYYYGWWNVNIIESPQGFSTLQQYYIEAKNIIFLVFFSLPFFSYSNNRSWQYFIFATITTASLPVCQYLWCLTRAHMMTLNLGSFCLISYV